MRAVLPARNVALVVALGATLACKGSSWADLEVPDSPYYLYNGRAIYLTYNTTRITVEADSAVVSQLPASAGVGVDSVRPFVQARGQWILWLSRGLSPGAAFQAALNLRLTPSVQFASNAYDSPEDAFAGCTPTLMLDNTLAVQFKSGVTSSEIGDLLQQMHTSGRPDQYIPSLWLLRYPVGMQEPPLQLANDLSSNPLVVFAEADKVASDCNELG